MQPKMDNQTNQMPQSPSQILSSMQAPPSPAQVPTPQSQAQMPPPSLPPPACQPNPDQFRIASPSPSSINQPVLNQNFYAQNYQNQPPQMPLNQINNFNPQYQKNQQTYTTPRSCAGCQNLIRDRHLLSCLDLYWHVQCLKCQMCKCVLSEMGEKCFTRDQMILCRDDYFKMYGSQRVGGKCESCTNSILANEQVMRVFNRVYHVDCFACQKCGIQLKPGDKYCFQNSRIFCEKDNPSMLNHMINQNQMSMMAPGVNTSPPSGSKRNGSNTKRAKTGTKAAMAQQQQQQQQQMMHQQQIINQQQIQMQQQISIQQQQHMQQQQQQQQQQHQQHQQQHQQQQQIHQQMIYQEHDQIQQQMQLQQQIIN